MNPKRNYEALFIFPPEEAPEPLKEAEKKLENTIAASGGRVLQRQDWGRRPLGYSIKKLREGRMLLWSFEMETHRVEEFRKTLELDEKLLKVSIFSKLEPKPTPEPKKKSPSLQKPFPERETQEAFRARQS